MKPSTRNFLADAVQLPWLNKVGLNEALPNAEPIESKVTAVKLLVAKEWDDFRLMLKNRNARTLNVTHYDRFKQWNHIATAARDVIERDIGPAVTGALKTQSIESGALKCIAWDVLLCAIEVEYADILPVRFYSDRLWPIYSAGHIPCGWSGSPIDETWATSSRPLPVGHILFY